MPIIAIIAVAFLCMVALGFVLLFCYMALENYLPDFVIKIIKFLMCGGMAGALISGIIAIFLYLPY